MCTAKKKKDYMIKQHYPIHLNMKQEEQATGESREKIWYDPRARRWTES